MTPAFLPTDQCASLSKGRDHSLGCEAFTYLNGSLWKDQLGADQGFQTAVGRLLEKTHPCKRDGKSSLQQLSMSCLKCMASGRARETDTRAGLKDPDGSGKELRSR
eukprot:1232246-Karenia_brevis.AAC.1